MTVSEILIAFFLSFGFSMLISLIAYKATGISYAPGDATKAAEELVKQMNEIEELQNNLLTFVDRGGIGLWRESVIETKPSPPTTASCVTSASHKRCAYCGCTNDHIYGTCDYCGAPLEG